MTSIFFQLRLVPLPVAQQHPAHSTTLQMLQAVMRFPNTVNQWDTRQGEDPDTGRIPYACSVGPS